MVSGEPQLFRILIVDDDENDFILLKRLLENSHVVHYNVEWASDMESARRLLIQQGIDAVLVDYRLGCSNGLDLLRDSKISYERPPVILLTGRDDPEVDREAMEAGASDYLSKTTISAGQLDRVIRYTVRDHRAQEMARQSNRLLDGLTSHLPLSVMWLNDKGILRDWRGNQFPWLGMPITKISGSPLAEIVPEFKNSILQAQAGKVAPMEWISHDGQVTSVFEITFLPEPRGGGGVIGLMMDVTKKARAESQVKRQSDLLASMAEHLPIMIGRLDKDGRITEIHGLGLKRLKMEPQEITSVDPSQFYPFWRERLRQLGEAEMISFGVGGHLDDQPWNFEAYLFKENPPLQGILFFALDLTGQRDVERKVLDAMESERQRIGMDLHDGLGQQLTGISCLAQSLAEKLDDLPQLSNEAGHIVNRITEAIEQARGLARGLCPVQIETMGLASALADLAYTVERVHGKHCTFEGDNEAELQDHEVAVHLYRIAQEAVHNAIKHSGCEKIRITLKIGQVNGLMTIEDDGKGLPSEMKHTPSIGMSSLGHRASLIRGTVSIHDGTSKGLQLECNFPIRTTTENNGHAKYQKANK